MGAVQLPDELQRVIEQQVAEGQATSTVAFLEEAVLRLVDERRLEQQDLQDAVQAGLVDIEAGHYTLVATPEDDRRLDERLMARLRDRLAAEE
jgi:predicted transcriptional regulator